MLTETDIKASDSSSEYDFGLDEYSTDEEGEASFRLSGTPLNPPLQTKFTTTVLHQKIHEGQISLDAPYQREVVWPSSKQTSLIDSLWMNYHIPSIVFISQKDEEGDELLVCVDGKQRLTSIQRFLDGQIPYKIGKKVWWFTLPEKRKPNNFEIPKKYKDIFLTKEVKCDIYHDVTEDREREMFRRVQLGMVLTAAEKLRAISSPTAEWIAQLEGQHVLIDEGLADALTWDLSRGKPYHNIMQMVYCCDGYPEEERTSFGGITKWLERTVAPSPDFKAKIDKVLKDLWQIATTRNLKSPFAAGAPRLAPVEFIFIGVLLYALRDYDLETKSQAISEMRAAIRSAHVDIRTNTKVAKTLWSYVKQLKRNPSTSLLELSHRPNVGRPAKRRKTKSYEDDDDYVAR